MDSTGSQDSGRGGARRSGKSKPQQFMFIDSTSQGVNAKPDKAVRSFVMKSARSKKSWSTRQRNSKSSTNPDADSPPDEKQSPPTPYSRLGNTSPASQGHSHWPVDTASSPNSISTQALSPLSNSSPSFFSPRKYTVPYFSNHAVACSFPHCTGDICGRPHETQTTLAARNGFAVDFAYSFDCLPVPTNERVRSIIDIFVHQFASILIPIDHHRQSRAATTRWLASSMQSPSGAPLIYTVLTSGALTLEDSPTKPREVLSFKTQAIGSINAQLQDPQTRVDDNNIAAVLMLLSLEEYMVAENQTEVEAEWSEANKQTHRKGLSAMVQQRGGLVALGTNRCLQTFILMHSVAHAVAAFNRPYTALLDNNGQPPPYDMPSFRPQPSSTRTLRLFQSLKLDPALLDIVGNIVVFLGDLNAWLDEPLSPLDPFEFQKNMCLLIYRLFDWYMLGEENLHLERNPVDQSICMALIIFLYASHEQRYQGIVLQVAQKLKVALSKCLFSWGKATDLLVWTLTIGALATKGKEDFAFFKENCKYAYANQGLTKFTTHNEMLDRMRKCLWVGGILPVGGSPTTLDQQAKALWSLMGYKQEEVYDSIEDYVSSPEPIVTQNVVGGITGDRFFSRKKSESQ